MANILLVNPPIVPTGEIMPPTGLCSVAAWLLADGHSVSILDLALELRLAGNHDRDTMRAVAERELRATAFDIVGVTSMYNNSIFAEHLIALAKSVRPSVFTVAAGPHFGANAKRAIERLPQLDAAITGEGEIAIRLIARHLDGVGRLDAIPNISYRGDTGEVYSNESAELINLREYDFNVWRSCVEAKVLDLHRYASTIPDGAQNRAIYVEAGRGCPYDCTFCAPAQFWSRKYRIKPAKVIVDELRFLHETAGYDYFLLVHDLLTANRSRAIELATAISALDLPIQWMANSRVDIDLKEHLELFKRSGCRKFFFGVESASERMQAEIGKHLETDRAREAVRDLNTHGISATCSFVIGLPSETPAELSKTIGYGAQLALLGAETVQYHRLRLFPPAPLATAKTIRNFDLETLKLEFPFADPEPIEVGSIQSDPEFFSGYFAPRSSGGSSEQLAQVELVFQQMVSLAPFSLAALYNLCGDKLVGTFYDWLSLHGTIPREAIDWVSTRPATTWKVILPILRWIADQHCRNEDAFSIASEAFAYDEARLGVLWRRDHPADSAFPEDSGATVRLEIDVARAMSSFSNGTSADRSLLGSSMAIFFRAADGNVVALQAN